MIDVNREPLAKAEHIEHELSQPPPSQNNVFQGITN